jgi:phenylalanyl-tRNA synthetase beta chain
MDVSYKWIQEEYFNEPLPDPKDLVERITKGAWEVEQVEKRGDDYLIDVDVLPNRAHDCLCHRGVAKEIGVLLGKKAKEKVYPAIDGDNALSDALEVQIEASALCPRYIGRYVKGIQVKSSPEWLKTRVESIGQRSINNIVDVTNYILFGIGQPLHVFDADKIEGGQIIVRPAKKGEKLETLDGKHLDLDETMLVIADSKDPIALAGIKGGKKAEVDEHTTNIVIESANFNSVSVRKTSRKTQIKTDASKRYENGITSEMAGWGMDMATQLIAEIAGDSQTAIGPKKDVYVKKEEQRTVIVSLDKIRGVLGVDIPEADVEQIFDRFGFEYIEKDDTYSISVPFERVDMCIAEDVAEDVGRVYGYDAIEEKLPESMDFTPQVHKTFYFQNMIRQFLVERGYSELQTYVFRESGEVELANPLAKDKPFIRASLFEGIFDSLMLNARNVDLLGIDTVNVFEIGTVFHADREFFAIGIGYHDPKKKKSKANEKKVLEELLLNLSKLLGEKVDGEIVDRTEGGAVAQIDFAALLEKLEAPKTYGEVLQTDQPTEMFKPLSPYPFVTRDIAVFVPEEKDQDALEKILVDGAGELLVRDPRLFDVFKKENEDGTSLISYAYKLVFQSHEKTLTDDEVNAVMDGIYTEISTRDGWEVR